MNLAHITPDALKPGSLELLLWRSWREAVRGPAPGFSRTQAEAWWLKQWERFVVWRLTDVDTPPPGQLEARDIDGPGK